MMGMISHECFPASAEAENSMWIAWPRSGDCRNTGSTRGLLGSFLFATLAVLATGASHRTENFLVTANEAGLARQVALAAEQHRRELSLQWLGAELPAWGEVCPVRVWEGDDLPANGQTSFVFLRGRPTDWRMSLQGSRQNILDSVLPHEVAHTIFATYFGRPLPRWLEEGLCVAVEDESTRVELDRVIASNLLVGRGMTLERLFALQDYPRDILGLYSQGYSLTRFLIAQGGERKLLLFMADGVDSSDWSDATRKHYGFGSLPELQQAWTKWVLGTDAVAQR
jgi:hypothetical protein